MKKQTYKTGLRSAAICLIFMTLFHPAAVFAGEKNALVSALTSSDCSLHWIGFAIALWGLLALFRMRRKKLRILTYIIGNVILIAFVVVSNLEGSCLICTIPSAILLIVGAIVMKFK